MWYRNFRSRLMGCLVYGMCCGAALFSQATAGSPSVAAVPSPAASVEGRPSVALVLGGGGAKAFAHIPVLEVLEELGIPIDMIIGNSAGAIVGGLMSIGYTPAEIRDILLPTDWTQMFADSPVSPLEPLLEGRSQEASPVSFKLGKNFSLEVGGGISTGQNAYELLKGLTVKIPSYVDFDSFDIPFRAVAVDLLSGELELIAQGDLAETMRSSMSIPGVFQPFPVDGKVFVDGFVRNNLPIQQARDMGYDIVIAVSIDNALHDNPEHFDSALFNTVYQMMNILVSVSNSEQMELASVLLYPDINEYNMMEFSKAQQIYDRSVRQKEEYRKALLPIRDQIFPRGSRQEQEMAAVADSSGFSFTPVANPQTGRRGRYNDLPYMVPEELAVYGAVESDLPFIRQLFGRIQGSPLTPERLGMVMDSIYATGNYTLASARLDVRRPKPCMELFLKQVERENWIIIPKVLFAGTLTDDFISKLSFALDVQFRGLTGTGSVMSLQATVINDFGLGLFLMQPLGPRSYIQFSASGVLEHEFITSGFKPLKIVGNKLVYGKADLLWGMRFNELHRLHVGGALYWFKTDEIDSPELDLQRALYPAAASVAIPLNLCYIFNTFDAQVFPSRGFYVRLDNTGTFPLMSQDAPVGFNMSRLDFSAAIPIDGRLSLIVNTMGASDVSLQLEKIPAMIPLFGVTLGDRMFFPNVAGTQQFGTHKFAGQVSLQFKPWRSITLVGGQLFFSLTGTVGLIAMSHNDFSLDRLNWNALFGAGLKVNRAFSVMFRAGVGTTHSTVMPFVSLDFGSLRY